ncbi:acetyl-CoA synthetase-like protein [Fomes fomentarius]|nr:acetyl-CoA synthetase-like protein [Fomes fomentarius]
MATVTSFRSPRTLIETGRTTIPELFEWHAKENPDYPLFRFHDGSSLKDISYSQAIRGVRHVARYVRSFAGVAERVPVAILANTDSITYVLTSVGILRAGHIKFPISVRNGSAAVAELMRRTNCRHILVSEDEHMRGLAEEVTQELNGVVLHPMPTDEELLSEIDTGTLNDDDGSGVEYNPDDVAMILHSSGSTSHPKPIFWTHKRMVSRGTVPWYGEVDLTGDVLGVHGAPMFHALGVFLYFTAVTVGIVLGVFPPTRPLVHPSPENVFAGAVAISANYIVTFPPFIEEWARDPAKVAHMKRIKGVWFGGGEVNKEAGDALSSQGISLIIVYGCTEVGAVANVIPVKPGMDYAYFTISRWIETIQVDAGDGKYEIIVLSPPECPLAATNTKVNDRDAYATNDLVIPHPTRPGLWKLYGRRDDQIVLANGEKTNPLPLERIINEDPLVEDCLIFGNGRVQNGVLVQPTAEFAFDPTDEQALASFRNKIWPTIERVNAFAPQQSRIFKEMVLVTSPSKPFDYNAKGNVRRNPLLQRYATEIDTLYSEVERTAQGDVTPPRIWDALSTKLFVRDVVNKVLVRPVPDHADLFRNGCDSLQATWLRNTILRALRESSPSNADLLPMDIVFKSPSIDALSDVILGGFPAGEPSTVDLLALADEYSSGLPPRPSTLRRREQGKDVVLITGTTRGFGCDVLEHLLRDETIETVYAFNRRNSEAMARQRDRFRERGLQVELLDLPKFRMVEVDLELPGFAIDPKLLDEIRCSVTHIMHNAWKVDYNMALRSFLPELKAVKNLVELALASPYVDPPKIQFVSSIGVLRNCTLKLPVPEVHLNPSSALGTGYAEAKWVVERTLDNVMKSANIPVLIIRLGQICGDRRGHWNEKEWFPALVRSSMFTGCLPDLDGDIAFIPSYPAARAFVEMRNSQAGAILHLVHPRRTPWHTLIAAIAEELGVPGVPYTEWMNALERCAVDSAQDEVKAMQENPALRLMEFFKRGPISLLPISSENAQKASTTLASLPELGPQIVREWLTAWRSSGFLT